MKEQRLTRNESRLQTRVKLIEAAELVFVRVGFDAASVEQIAAEAGFSRGAFYSNFESKDELFLELLDKKRSETQDDLDTIFREKKDAKGRFVAAREWYANQSQERTWTVIKTEFSLRALRKRALRKRLSTLWQQELETYSALLDQYFLEAGLTSPESPRTIAVSLLATAQGLGMMSLLHSDSVLDCSIAAIRKLAFERLVPSPSGKVAMGGRPGRKGKR